MPIDKLPDTGPLKASEIDEAIGDVGLDTPRVSLSEYYKDTAILYLNDAPSSENLAKFGPHPNSGSPISFGDLYGDSGIFQFELTGNRTETNLRDEAISQGWNQTRTVVCKISGSIRSTSTSTPALTVGEFPNGIVINNYAKIMGKGGNGSSKSGAPTTAGGGGTAIAFTSLSPCTINNYTGGYICGGGGGGSRSSRSGGGGGAGGGNGGAGGGVDSSGGDGSTQFSGGVGATTFNTKGGNGGYLNQTEVYGRGGEAGGSGGGYKDTSDKRLKRNIKLVGTSKSGINIYEFNYIWSFRRYRGVIAQELLDTYPNAVKKCLFGFYKVNYDLIDVKFEKL